MFDDRTDGGEQLGELLADRGVDADIVLAIPRGGLPVGRAVADALGLPLDVVVARKLPAPGNPELAVGAVAADGTAWLNEAYRRAFGLDEGYLRETTEREREAAAEKLERYRGDRTPLALAGKRVIIVDDGLATGATALACVRQARADGAAHVVVAAPVGPPRTLEALRAEAEEVVCVETPANFGAVGQVYRSFAQVSDAEAVSYLE